MQVGGMALLVTWNPVIEMKITAFAIIVVSILKFISILLALSLLF